MTHVIKVKNLPPKILTDSGLSMFVDAVELRELPLPLVNINIAELVWHFAMPVWEKDGTDDWNLTPQEVIDKVPGSRGHQKRVAAVDTSYPILITWFNSRWVIIDGVHRLVKTFITGEKTINAKNIPSKYLSRKEYWT